MHRPKVFHDKDIFFPFSFSFSRGHLVNVNKMHSASSFASLWLFFKFLVNCDKCVVVKRLTKCLALFEHLLGKAN